MILSIERGRADPGREPGKERQGRFMGRTMEGAKADPGEGPRKEGQGGSRGGTREGWVRADPVDGLGREEPGQIQGRDQ